MRIDALGDGLSVRAVAGTHVVLFGFDVPPDRLNDLLGFAIKKTDLKGQTSYLDNFLLLKVNDQGQASDHSSYLNPFQAFVWGDYTLSPAEKATYEVQAMYGQPGHLSVGAQTELTIETESEADGTHAIFFNRGVAGSQRYAKKFQNQAPDQAGPEAFAWLSRGLAEAMTSFIARANGPTLGLRAAVYEFDWAPLLDAFAEAERRGADVKIVYDAVPNATPKNPVSDPRDRNQAAIAAAGLTNCIERTTPQIAHNKFIVLLENGIPTEVWTGSTNFTEGALYGQWNVGHIVRDRDVARRYLAYWTELSQDPAIPATRQWDETATPVPREPPPGITSILSPRAGLAALDWYATLMDSASTSSVFLTAAFGVSKELTKVFAEKKEYLRYLLLDKRTGTVKTIARNPSNQITAGAFLGQGNDPWSNWLTEKLTDLNQHVQYVHTKFMLLNPLTDDPIVITGSANFSEASTTANDENMLVIRGDTRVADIYLGEFMRLFTHFRFRGRTQTPNRALAPGPDNPAPTQPQTLYLRPDDSWARPFYVKDSPRQKERLLFRAPPSP